MGKLEDSPRPLRALDFSCLGVVTRSLSHRGVDFAPKAVAILALAWLFPLAATRWLHAPPEGARELRFHHFLVTGQASQLIGRSTFVVDP